MNANPKELVSRIRKFIRTDLWRDRLEELPKSNQFLYRQLRILIIAIRGFTEDAIKLRASALTYFSLLSIVPVIAMAFGISKGFGLQKILEAQLVESFAGQEEILKRVFTFSSNMLENTKGGLIAGIGLIFLLFIVMGLLTNIEEAFNEIWRVKKARTPVRKLTDYLTIMLIAPILFVFSGSLTIYLNTFITNLTEQILLLGYFKSVILFLLKLIPFVIIWLLFTLIYMIMPNTRVSFRSALFAAIIAGTLYQVLQVLYINFQVGVSRYNAIYGSFAALPLFLIWLQVSWFIILLGAEISYATQHVDDFEFHKSTYDISASHRRLIALMITHTLIKNFCNGNKPMSVKILAKKLRVPGKIIEKLLNELEGANIVNHVKSLNGKREGYQPAQDPNKLSIFYVIDSLDRRGFDDLLIESSEELSKINEYLDNFKSTIENSSENKLLKEI